MVLTLNQVKCFIWKGLNIKPTILSVYNKQTIIWRSVPLPMSQDVLAKLDSYVYFKPTLILIIQTDYDHQYYYHYHSYYDYSDWRTALSRQPYRPPCLSLSLSWCQSCAGSSKCMPGMMMMLMMMMMMMMMTRMMMMIMSMMIMVPVMYRKLQMHAKYNFIFGSASFHACRYTHNVEGVGVTRYTVEKESMKQDSCFCPQPHLTPCLPDGSVSSTFFHPQSWTIFCRYPKSTFLAWSRSICLPRYLHLEPCYPDISPPMAVSFPHGLYSPPPRYEMWPNGKGEEFSNG